MLACKVSTSAIRRPAAVSRFTVIAPREYKKALAHQGSEAEATEPAQPAEMAATNA